MEILIFYLIISLIEFLLMGYDKRRALKGAYRLPEAFLLTVALLGGFPGCLAGMLVFHHKTRKPHFWVVIFFGIFVHITLLWKLFQV